MTIRNNVSKKNDIELLAPAGNFECLKAAVANGADAVYLGGPQFNAREGAENFSGEMLESALSYAAERGVRVYITLNTLIKDDEIDEALRFAGFVYEKGADAVIVQDIGLARLLRRHFPDMRLHASTQMTITNLHGIRQCEEAGISRVVLARELNLDEIEYLSSSSQVETEVFVHGALCISYSGQCLMSSFIGGRSGNRGRCAQPCRLPWSVCGKDSSWSEDAYILSTKDLMGLSLLPALKKSGISSLKIEGRMKSPEYVALVTAIYRKYLDRLKTCGEGEYRVDQDDIERLEQIFNRGGFTDVYLKGAKNFRSLVYTEHPKNRGVRIGTVIDSTASAVRVRLEKPLGMGDGIEVWDFGRGVPDIIVSSIVLDGEHVRHAPAGTSPWVGDMKLRVEKGSQVWRTYSKPLMAEARESFERGEVRRVPLKAIFRMSTGDNACLVLSDPDGNMAKVFSEIPAEKAEKRPLDEERIIRQLQKTGDTPYAVEEVQVETDGISTLPVSAINDMRRRALAEISEARKRMKRRQIRENIYSANLQLRRPNPMGSEPSLTAFFLEKPRIPEGYDRMVSRIYIPLMGKGELEALRENFRGEIFAWTPNILRGKELEELGNALEELKGLIDGVSAANPGTMHLLREFRETFRIHADFQMNLFNSLSLAVAAEWGASSASVSPELRLDEAVRLKPHGMELEAQVYGRVQLMTMEYCPSVIFGRCRMDCGGCMNATGFIRDRKGKIFPYIREAKTGRTMLFSPEPVFMDRLDELKDSCIRRYRMVFTDEDDSEIGAVTNWFHDKLSGTANGLKENDRLVLERLLERGVSKGHWFRGV